MNCFECGSPAIHNHHVIPRSLGGAKTVPLCQLCHSKAHGINWNGNLRELTRTAMQFKKAKGERIGAIPFGYSLDVDGVSLTENADEQEVISVAKELKASGLSLRAIATELSERGYTARNGRNFQATQIQRILNARETDRVLRGGRG
jgi:hypothetical protein